jgi:hypothetical protein
MNEDFQKIIETFPGMMVALVNSEPILKKDFSRLPNRGIYVFYENGRPVYVGRTNRMRDRLHEHGRISSGHFSATFAFNLAKEDPRAKDVVLSQQRKNLEKDPLFSKIFSEAKDRVARMEVRTIEIQDPVVQTLFEVYAALELKTENLWENH